MKKRLLSMLLLVTMVAAALPLGAMSFPSLAAEADEMSEEDYDRLYVTSELVYSLDFFKLNEYWSPEGHDYAIPTGPSDDTAYYDAVSGKTFDFTVEGNRFAYTVTKTDQGGATSTVGSYLGEAEANAAVAALTATATEGVSYTAVRGTALNAAWARAVADWNAADITFFREFERYAATLMQAPVYFSSSNSSFESATSGDRHRFARSGIASLGNGYVTTLAAGSTYANGGGLQLLKAPAGLGTAEVVSVLGDSLSPYGGYFLFNNIGLVTTKNETAKTYTVTSGLSGRSASLGAISSASPFSYDRITTMTYTMKDGELAVYNGTEAVLRAAYTGTLTDSNYIGWAGRSVSTRLYAIRYYSDVLSRAESAQNHFADIAKFFRLDVSAFAAKRHTFGEEALTAYYGAFASLDFDASRAEAQAVADAAFKTLVATVSYPKLSAEDYNSLYVRGELLFQFDFFLLNEFWNGGEALGTIEVGETGAATDANVIAWLKQFVVTNTTAPVFRLEHGTSEFKDAEGTYSPHIPFHVKNGYVQFKEPEASVGSAPPYFQIYFPASYTLGENGFALESLLSYDAVKPGVKGNVWLPWAFSLSPQLTLDSESAFTIKASGIWSSTYTLASRPGFTHNGKPFSLVYNMKAEGTGSTAAILADGTTLTTGTYPQIDGGRTCNIGYYYGSYGMKLYGMRVYDRTLSEAEIRQNHFADIAKYFRLDVSELIEYAPLCRAEDLDACYAAFASLDFTSTRAAAQAVADAAMAILKETVAPRETSEEFYNALYVKQDLLFQLDFFALNAIWDRAAEYGTITAASTSAATKSAVVSWLKQFVVANPGGISMAIQGTAGDSGALSFEHQIPFFIKDGYIQYKSVTDGYTVNNNNPYLQFLPNGTDVYNNGGFTWELLTSFDEFGKKDSFFLPALSDLRPRATTAAPTEAFTVNGANGTAHVLSGGATLTHGGRAFDLTYRLEAGAGSYDTVLSADGKLLGSFHSTTPFAGRVCDFGWNFSGSGAKIYAVRIYDRSLSDAELARNHFADLAKFFRLQLDGFENYGTADKERFYAAFASYDLATASYAALQKAYTDLAVEIAVESYEAQYLEGDAFAAHNAFIDACIDKILKDRGAVLSLASIYAIPLSARDAIYALSGDALTQKAIDDAVAEYWRFDADAYVSYDTLYYDEGNLVLGYDFFALNSYWNADRAEGYLPIDTLMTSWESHTADGDRYFDRFAVKGRLSLLHEGRVIPFSIPTAEQRGGGGFVLLGGNGRAADGFGASGLGGASAITAEAVLRVDAASSRLFSALGLSFGIENGVYTAPNGINAPTAEGVGAAAPIGSVATYSLGVCHGGNGRAASLSLTVDGERVYAAAGAAMADSTGSATLGLDQSLSGAVYAIRYYRTALTEHQRAQNHFADIAKFYRLDLADLRAILCNEKATGALYAAMADFGFGESREAVQARYDEFRAAYLEEHEALGALREEVSALLAFEGYQVRIAAKETVGAGDYAGMRAIFSMNSHLLTMLEDRGYTVLVDVRTRNVQKGHPYRNKAAIVPIYNGSGLVAKNAPLGDGTVCFAVTVAYASDVNGAAKPYGDALLAELMLYDAAYEYAVTLQREGESYTFTFGVDSERFGAAVNAKELYQYFGTEGDGMYQGSLKNDGLVKKMLSLIPPEKSAAPSTVGRLTLAEDGKAEYRIVLQDGASDAERAAAEGFAAALSELTGARLSLCSELGLRTDREILIANGSARADAAAFSAAASARGLAYAIGTSGERILVYGRDGAALADALAILLASVTDNRINDAMGDNANSFYLPAALSVTGGGGAESIAAYALALPHAVSTAHRALIDGYIDAIAARTGAKLTVVDGAASTEAAAFLAECSYTGYAVAVLESTIALSAYTDVALRAAFSALCAAITDGGELPADLALTCDFGAGQGVPHFGAGATLSGGAIYDAGESCYTLAYTGVGESEYRSYCGLLAEKGFARYAENERNGCLFATYTGPECVLNIAFYPMHASVRITISPVGAMLPNAEGEAYVKNPAVTPSVTLMDHELASYVMQLEDGSFLIVDGGDLNRAGAMDKMWEHLTSLTPAGQKPVISLWMLTHGHSDHVLLMASFLEKYHDDLVLKAVAFNFPNYEALDVKMEAIYTDPGARDPGIGTCAARVYEVLERYYPDTEHWIPRTGEKHAVAGARIEILYSQEDYYPAQVNWGNDTSSAWLITLGGTSIVYLGDCTAVLCKQIAAAFGETLEADILQVAHHGVGGGDLYLYQLIDPKICLFGTSIGEFTGDRCNGTGNYTSYDYNAWVRNTDWTRTEDGVERSGERAHYHGSVRTTILLPIE